MEFVIDNWHLFLGLAVVLLLLFADPLQRRFYGVGVVTPLQLPALTGHEHAVVVDVSEPEEFRAGHVPAAIPIPLARLGQELKKLEKYRDRPVVLCCRSGRRSLRGAILLRRNGFVRVYNLGGGILAWQRDGLPVEK